MGKILLFLFVLFFSINLGAQKTLGGPEKIATVQRAGSEVPSLEISIYPVPVSNNTFTIKSDKDISHVKVTNMIGQDILREKFSTPQQLIRITLPDPQRGMYLVTITFIDGFRIVKKIMIESAK